MRSVMGGSRAAATGGEVDEPVDLHELVPHALRLSRVPANAPQTGLVRLEVADALPILAPRHRILEILVNLVNNAWDALDGARASGELQAAPRIVVRAGVRASREAWFEVEDNGPGIPDEIRSSIFKFGFTTKPNGQGIGLHASANTAATLGGSLKLAARSSEPGCLFRLAVPCRPVHRTLQEAA